MLAVYLTHVGTTSIYGAGSSLALLLLWAYYSSQILAVRRRAVRVYAEEVGSHVGGEDAHDGRWDERFATNAGRVEVAVKVALCRVNWRSSSRRTVPGRS